MTAPRSLASIPQVTLRDPDTVMRLERMGSFHATRLSFSRSVIRQLIAEQAEVTRPFLQLDDDGYGHAVYSVELSGHTYSLVAFTTPLDPDRRTDRVIAEAWDSAFVLFDGVPTRQDIERLAVTAPLQEAGRFTGNELVLSRANKSARLFGHVVDRLAAGEQPDETLILDVGYLMRTTAVYGNGKFGISDRQAFVDRPGMAEPFRPEMLTVWLIRAFTLDLVEHIARRKSPDTFVPLAPRLRRFLGIGNATGLGMAPFLVTHPTLINNWMAARETALARVRAVRSLDASEQHQIVALLARARGHVDQWNVAEPAQMGRIRTLRIELAAIADLLTGTDLLADDWPIDRLIRTSEQCSLELQELVVGLVLEPFGELVDGLTHCMLSTTDSHLDPSMRLTQVRELVADQWQWALDIDFDDPAETAQFWYVSEDKLEPRLGLRYEEPGAELEQSLDIARRVQALHQSLREHPDGSVASFLMARPEHRLATRRVQTLARFPYGEIRDNLISDRCTPCDMLRSKLAMFGATRFDPKSDRWTRITLFQGAPGTDELDADHADDWWLPVLQS